MNTPEAMPNGNDGNMIKLAEDRGLIENKLEEYRSRLQEHVAPELQLDTIYKIAITERLVNYGQVNMDELADEIEEKYGSINYGLFNNACGVIKDYINTGGRNTVGGTGLHTDNSEDDTDGGVM